MTTLLAIDPGPKQSAWVLFEGKSPCIWEKEENEKVLQRIKGDAVLDEADVLIEMISCAGMAGKETYETCYWIGRFFEAAQHRAKRMMRVRVKSIIYGSTRCKDKHMRAAMIAQYGKLKMAGDEWQACALGAAYLNTQGKYCL